MTDTLKDRLDNSDASEREKQMVTDFINDWHESLTCECMGHDHSCNYPYAKIDGKYYKRDTTYFDVNELCHDCGIPNKKGNTHHGCCDMEMCVACGEQFLLDGNHKEIDLLSELPKGARLTKSKYDLKYWQRFLNDDIIAFQNERARRQEEELKRNEQRR